MRLGIIASGLAIIAAFFLGSTAVTSPLVDVSIEEQNGSGVTGSAVVVPTGSLGLEQAPDGQTETTLSLIGLEPGSSHVNHIHEGTGCGAGEYTAVVETLTSVDADESGDGTATTTVNLAFAEVTNGSHVFVIHAGATLADDPTPIACGHIPVFPVAGPAPDGVAAPSTGISGFSQEQSSFSFVIALAAALAMFGVASIGFGFAVVRIRR